MDTIEELNARIERLGKMVYPYYGIDKTLKQIILFTSPRCGINVNGKGWPLGYRSDGWAEDRFAPLYGRINIANGRVISTDDVESHERWDNR